MFGIFNRSLLKRTSAMAITSPKSGRSVTCFSDGMALEENLLKSIKNFEKAKEYFNSNKLPEAQAFITEAIEDALKISSITPNSFALKLFKFSKEIDKSISEGSDADRPFTLKNK